MARMREPFTGTVFEVAPGKVSARLASGWSLIDGEAPVAASEIEGTEPESEQAAEATEPNGRPTDDSTIAEIRAWAKANGVELPKKGNKAALLAAIE